MSAQRKVPAATAWRVALNTLGRMACVNMAPNDGLHDHETECLVDDEAYAADLLLRMVAATTSGDQDTALDRLTDLIDSIDPDS